MYGKELILDLEGCNPKKMTRINIEDFMIVLCDTIDMERCALHFWDYEGYPEEYKKAPAHLKGISAIQFITTSNITIHTLDELNKVFLNVFSCKNFKNSVVEETTIEFFNGKIVQSHGILRK